MTQASTVQHPGSPFPSDEFDVVTGAFSYSGGAIARRLLLEALEPSNVIPSAT